MYTCRTCTAASRSDYADDTPGDDAVQWRTDIEDIRAPCQLPCAADDDESTAPPVDSAGNIIFIIYQGRIKTSVGQGWGAENGGAKRVYEVEYGEGCPPPY